MVYVAHDGSLGLDMQLLAHDKEQSAINAIKRSPFIMVLWVYSKKRMRCCTAVVSVVTGAVITSGFGRTSPSTTSVLFFKA